MEIDSFDNRRRGCNLAGMGLWVGLVAFRTEEGARKGSAMPPPEVAQPPPRRGRLRSAEVQHRSPPFNAWWEGACDGMGHGLLARARPAPQITPENNPGIQPVGNNWCGRS
jgi:hypothetical protein